MEIVQFTLPTQKLSRYFPKTIWFNYFSRSYSWSSLPLYTIRLFFFSAYKLSFKLKFCRDIKNFVNGARKINYNFSSLFFILQASNNKLTLHIQNYTKNHHNGPIRLNLSADLSARIYIIFLLQQISQDWLISQL